MSIEIKVKKIHDDAVMPSFAHLGDSGFDLYYAGKDYLLKPGEHAVFGTGLEMEIPIGYEVQIRPKSGLALGYGITVLNSPGTIDSGYRGEVKVILVNHGQDEYRVQKGYKIAQGVVSKVEKTIFTEAEEFSETERGRGGFGSTGR